MNRLIRLTDPDDGVTEYEFDAGSRLVEMVYPSGAVASYDRYDAANRLLHFKTTDSTGTAAFTEFTYVYDSVGNRTAMIEPGGTTQYGYDDLYRLTGVTYPAASSSTYYYDAVGNRTREITGGVVKDYVYNNLNQLVTWSSGGTGTPTRLVTVTGTAEDADLSSVFVNQTEASFNGQTFTAEVLFTVGTNVITAIATDAAGNTASSQVECYYRPDLASLVEYEYDKNGCLARKTVDGTYYTVYGYDYENRLVEVTLPDSATNEFTYDGDKRRVSRKDAGGEEKWFLYDGINILQDLATDGTVWTSYVQGIGIDKLISVSEWAGQTSPQKRYYHSDALGSVRSLTNDDETEVGTYSYDAWGKVTSETGSSGNEYKFTSRRWEQDLGLQYNRARFYDPETGRFITPDPLTGGPDDPTIGYHKNIDSYVERAITEYFSSIDPQRYKNRYVYCHNNPINFIDPLGLIDPPDIEGGYKAGDVVVKGVEGGSIERGTGSDYSHTGIVGPDGKTVQQSPYSPVSIKTFFNDATHGAAIRPNVSEKSRMDAANWAQEKQGYYEIQMGRFHVSSDARTADTVNCAEFAQRAYTDGAKTDPGLPEATKIEGHDLVSKIGVKLAEKSGEINTEVPVRKPSDWMEAEGATVKTAYEQSETPTADVECTTKKEDIQIVPEVPRTDSDTSERDPNRE